MKKLIAIVFNRWVLIAVAVLALSLLIWIGGPLVALADIRPLESSRARWIAMASIVLVIALRQAWKAWRARRGNAAVVGQLLAPSPGADKKAVETPDMQAVRARFEHAMQTLRQARFGSDRLRGWLGKLGGRYLYELPWYLIIGAPGSGKTTALRHCGLQFPLAQTIGDQAVKGIGGTRDCDWWFTDRAVLIDTAGRFTTQDSDRDTDRSTWSGFLALLKRFRPRQALNGVLVTVSVIDLLASPAAERAQYAHAVRQRMQELHQELGLRFPIYLLVTKCDLLAGFMDYFAVLNKEQRAAPWGFTFPLTPAQQESRRFGPEFDALLQRLTDGLIDRLQTEHEAQRRTRIYGFPGQFAALRGVLHDFVESVFSPSPYEAKPMLRGVYFLSGTQEGTPIDRMMGSVARQFGLERAMLPPNQSSGKSYFLSRLLGDVVFEESGLAGTNLKWERRSAALVVAGYAAVALVTVAGLAAFGFSYVSNRRYVDEVAARVDRLRQQVQSTPNRTSADLMPILPALLATRDFASAGGGSTPWSLDFGLYQGDKLDSASQTAYRRMLVDAMLPRLALRVEDRLRQGTDAPETQYESLKAYLMMHDPQHFDAPALKKYVEDDWDSQLGRELSNDQRAELSGHLDALLSQGAAVSPLAEDKALVEATRTRIATIALPQRIYNRMRSQGLGNEFPEFTVTLAAGNNASLVFTRASGKPLSKGVPGLFSYKGYHDGFQPEVSRVAEQLAREQSWVLNIPEPPRDAAATVRANAPLVDNVRRLYLNEYAATWDAFISDVRLVPMTTLSQSVQLARLLSAPDNPLRPLLKAVSRETTLGISGARTTVEKAERRATDVVGKSRKALANLLTRQKRPAGGDAAPPIESIVDDRFAGLRQFVNAPEGGKAPIDDAVALIGELYVLLNAAETATKGGAAPPPSPVPNKVKSEAARLPEPARSVLNTLAQSSAQVAQILVRQNLGMEVRSQVGEFCQQALAGRYPVARNSSRDATQADFAALFAPGGKIDQLFQQKLASYVDTTTRPWSFRAVEGFPLGSDHGTLPQFQRAAAIRETFFPSGAVPTLRLDFRPVEMDPALTQFILDVDGQVVRYAHGPQIPTAVQWPGPRGSSQVRVELSPPLPGARSGMVADGPWALFRLFDRVKIDPTSAPERFTVTFDIDGRKAVFEVTASSVRNPFRLRELTEFSCPAGL